MKAQELQYIKTTYDNLNAGISNPVHINTAYQYLPNYVENSPMIAKIRAINRFMMLSYFDELKHVETETVEDYTNIDNTITDSIGTMENLPKQSHVEKVDVDDIQAFLTADEKISKPAGTQFKRTRSPNGQRKARK